jgi:hypothetical protein
MAMEPVEEGEEERPEDVGLVEITEPLIFTPDEE